MLYGICYDHKVYKLCNKTTCRIDTADLVRIFCRYEGSANHDVSQIQSTPVKPGESFARDLQFHILFQRKRKF